MKQGATRNTVRAQVEDLKTRLEEAEETLRAIRTGAVDALLVQGPEGNQVFTLEGAEHPYRVFIEAMHEGAATLTHDGTILYANQAFSRLVKKSLKSVIGTSVHALVAETDRSRFVSSLQQLGERNVEMEISLGTHVEGVVPVRVSLTLLPLAGDPQVCMVVTDLSERKAAEEALRRSEKRLRYLSSELLVTQEKEWKRVAS